MQNVSLKAATTCLLTIALSACGGGGSSSATVPTSNAGTASSGMDAATVNTGGANNGPALTSSNTPASTSSGTSATPSTFTAQITAAPTDGSTISGVVHFEIHGTGIENAELLPPSGYAPVLGTFTVSSDKTAATLEFNSASLPNGTLQLRVSAFNQPAGGTNAGETVAMPTRQWTVTNATPAVPAAIPDASYMPNVMVPFANLPYVDPTPLNDLWAMDDPGAAPYPNFGAYIANNWPQFEATLRRYVPANVTFDYPTPNGFYSAWTSCLGTHDATGCHETVLYLRSLMQSKQGG